MHAHMLFPCEAKASYSLLLIPRSNWIADRICNLDRGSRLYRHASYEALSEELDAHRSSEQREQQANEQQVSMHHLLNALQQVPPRTLESIVQHLEDLVR